VLYSGPYDYEALLELSNGPEAVSGTEAHTREGVVIRTVPERYSDVLGSRAIAKLVGSDYLTRSGGTEYE
jgi:RNA ligase (TIGR02306 family)